MKLSNISFLTICKEYLVDFLHTYISIRNQISFLFLVKMDELKEWSIDI